MTQMNTDGEGAAPINALTERVIGCAFRVSKALGKGFLEKVYENALAHECRKAGLQVEQQRRLIVMYDGIQVGEYVADMVIEGVVLVEIKSAKGIDPGHSAQCINYLACTMMPVCLLLNFTSKVEIKRLVGASASTFLASHLCPSVPSVARLESETPSVALQSSGVNPLASAILITWRRNGQYARRLVADLSPAQWTAQPVAGLTLNHPAWIFSHLNVYAPLCISMARGESFADPIDHKFGQRSEVSTNPTDYPHGPALLADYESLHTQAEEALVAAPAGVFAAANPLERWRTLHPTIGDMLVTLMVKHESGHLGQLSAWRRAMSLPRVAM